MISTILIVAIIAGAGWFVWRRWTAGRTPINPLPSEDRSPQTLAYKAFVHGTTCLVAGQFADATASWLQFKP